VCAPYFVNLNDSTFRLKTLLFFVHLRSQQREEKKSSPVIKFTVLHTRIYDDATTLLLAITANFKVVPTHEGSIGRQLARDSLTTTTVSRLPVLTLGDSCVPATVNFLQYLVTGSILTVAGPFQLPVPQSGTYFIRDPTISADCFRRLFKTYLAHSAR